MASVPAGEPQATCPETGVPTVPVARGPATTMPGSIWICKASFLLLSKSGVRTLDERGTRGVRMVSEVL